MTDTLKITLELGGGVELITSTPREKKHTITLPSRSVPCPTTFSPSSSASGGATQGSNAGQGQGAKITTPSGTTQGGEGSNKHDAETGPTTMRHLLHWVLSNLVVERSEMLVDSDTVRPGILVLINDADWELEGELDYELQDGDHVCFISTLHGG